MKKKVYVAAGVLSLTLALMTACSTPKSTVEETTVAETTTVEQTQEETTAEVTEDKGVRTGYAVISNIENSKSSTADANGTVQIDSILAAVIVDGDDSIIDVSFDIVQTKVDFDKTGQLLTDVATTFDTKKEIGDAYGMKAASAIGKEWYEQAEALEDYLIGKTFEEVKGIALTDAGVASDADLVASVSVKIAPYLAAIEKAVENATLTGANTTDTLGIAIDTDIANSKSFADGNEALVQAYSKYAVVTVNSEGAITSAIIDASQTDVNIDDLGQITTEVDGEFVTKNELKDAYGMKAASPIGKEWYEQAASLAEYVTGKTLDDVKGIAVDDATAPVDEDLKASVTMKIGSLLSVVEEAVGNAK